MAVRLYPHNQSPDLLERLANVSPGTFQRLMDIRERYSQRNAPGLEGYEAAGQYYAEIFADPQVMSSMNEMMPAVMEAIPSMLGNVGEIAQKYPRGRTFSALSSEEQDKLAALLGVTLDDLAASEPEGADAAEADEDGAPI